MLLVRVLSSSFCCCQSINERTGERRDKEEKKEIEKADIVDSSSNIDSQATSTLTWIVRPVFFFFFSIIISKPLLLLVLFHSVNSLGQGMTLTKYQNWYTSLPGHDYFCDVHEDFIEDDFNLTGTFRLPSSFSPFSSLPPFPSYPISPSQPLLLKFAPGPNRTHENRSTIINPILERSIRNGP